MNNDGKCEPPMRKFSNDLNSDPDIECRIVLPNLSEQEEEEQG